MKKIELKEIIYLYDGTFEGYLTVVFTCFKYKIIPKLITEEKKYIINLFEDYKIITTDYEKSDRVIEGIKRISEYSLHNVYTAFLSYKDNKENLLLEYIINLFRFGEKANYMRSINAILEVENIVRNVRREAHRFKGFVRFTELENNILYSKIEPDNNVIEIVSNYFKSRLKNENWIIQDTKNKKISLYNKKEFIIIDADETFEKSVNLKIKENKYENLWKCFYKNINIKERKNLRCQRNFMPKKYWKNILEVEESV